MTYLNLTSDKAINNEPLEIIFIMDVSRFLQSGGVMFSPLGRLRVAQAVRKQVNINQLLSD